MNQIKILFNGLKHELHLLSAQHQKIIQLESNIQASAPSTVYDAIVVGAGISGLSAAKWLKENGLAKVLVLEARDRIGGRTYTKRDPKVDWVDLGGAYVGPSQDHLVRVARELKIKMFMVNEDKEILCIQNGKRYTFNTTELPNFGDNGELWRFYKRLDQLGRTVPVREPWKAPNATQLDSMTVKEFLDKEFFVKDVRDFGHWTLNTFLAVPSHECSLLFFVWFIKQAHGTRSLFWTAEDAKFYGGSQLISDGLADKIGRKNIQLSKFVNQIKQEGDIVKVSTIDHQIYAAKNVIIALPPNLISGIYFEPALHPLKAQLYQRMPMGSVIKTVLYYNKPWWRGINMSGTLMLGVNDEEFPAISTLDDTKPNGSKPAIMGFIVANKARKIQNLSTEERRDRIAESYAKAFGSDKALRPIHYEELDWQAEKFSAGGFTGFLAPGVLTAYGPYLRKRHGSIFFAGTETATVWSGYMSGAVEAGERAAREVLVDQGLLTRDKIWRNEPPSKGFL